jgi:micrococcal nuclease
MKAGAIIRATMILIISGNCWGKELTGVVTRVIDGDTIVVNSGTESAKIRLAEIDAPESKQAHGQVATHYLAGLILNRQVTIQYSKSDRYGRIIGTVMLADQNINSQMISTGRAWHYKKYSKSPTLASLESTARARSLGLWGSDNPMAPWTFRKR